MHPALSVLFLTTLIGAGQGLLLALVGVEYAASLHALTVADLRGFLLAGSVLSFVLTGLGLFSSFFHLGHPERAWRAMAGWRTSWLAREGIALPVFMAALFAYGVGHALGGWPTLAIGIVAAVCAAVLFVCTGMIYAAIKAIREWASPLTVVNYAVLGSASGVTLASALAVVMAPEIAPPLASVALALTVVGLVSRGAALVRNARLKPKSTLQTAIGVRHPKIVQKAQGSMGGSFNTREFFHGASAAKFKRMRTGFIAFGFVAPALLLATGAMSMFVLAFVVQYLGLLAERWFFFAQANHPQNLYYRSIA